MTHNEKKSLYESIMKNVAKTVKRMINETDDSIVLPPDMLINNALEFIEEHNDMYDYYLSADIKDIIDTQKVSTMCTDGTNIYYNWKFTENINEPKDIAYLILHCCAHINMGHKSTGNMEDDINMDKKVNRYLEERWPEFQGTAQRLNGFI